MEIGPQERKLNLTIEEVASACSKPLPPRAIAGLEFFNHGQYFEAHEALEDAWRAEQGPQRHLYHGILQVGVAYYHLLRGNFVGTIKMFRRSHGWLEPFTGECCGIDLDGFRNDFNRVEAEVQRLGPDNLGRFNRELLKPIRYRI